MCMLVRWPGHLRRGQDNIEMHIGAEIQTVTSSSIGLSIMSVWGEPQFGMKAVQFHRSALSRQVVGEAVRIHRRGLALNSKIEYNGCSISRLSLEQGVGE